MKTLQPLNCLRMKKRFKPVLLLLLFCCVVKAQQQNPQGILTEEELIKLTLESNFDILIARNNEQIAKNNNNIGLVGGNASTNGNNIAGSSGFLPQITFTALPSYQNNNIHQKLATGNDIKQNGVVTTNVQAGIGFTWYFFDGLKMFATKKKLNRYEELSNLNYRLAVENALLATLTAYYQMVSINQYIKSLKLSLNLAEDQKNLAEQKLKAGTGSNVDVLQTRIDYNNIQVEILNQINVLSQQKIGLNTLLKRPSDVEFNVPDTIIIGTKPEYQSALENTNKNNTNILIGSKNIEISELGLKEYRGNRFPRLGAVGGYSFSRTKNAAGLYLLNQAEGLNLGLTASWNLLNNLATHTAIKNQLVNINSDKLRLEEAQVTERANLYFAFVSFQANLNIIDIEKQSVDFSNQSLQIASQRFKIGISNYIEYRTVEQSYEETVYRLSQASFNAKLSELSYLKEQGLLVRQQQ